MPPVSRSADARSTSSRPADAGQAALRQFRRALLRAGVAAGSLAVLVVMVFGNGSERPLREADRGLVLDEVMTGSIAAPSRYVSSRSVLQAPGSSPCLLYPDGSRRGDC